MDILPFPSTHKEPSAIERAKRIDAMTKERFGVSAAEYYSHNRTPEVQKKIDRALQKETLFYASKHN